MFCKNCGAPIGDNAKFCEQCGVRIERGSNTPEQVSNIPEQNTDTAESRYPLDSIRVTTNQSSTVTVAEKLKKDKKLIIIAAIAIVVLASILYFSLGRGGSGNADEKLGYFDGNEWGMTLKQLEKKYPSGYGSDTYVVDFESLWGIEGADAKVLFYLDSGGLYKVSVTMTVDEGNYSSSDIHTQMQDRLNGLYGNYTIGDLGKYWYTDESDILLLKLFSSIMVQYTDVTHPEDDTLSEDDTSTPKDSTSATSLGGWTKKYYLDEFQEPTDESYIRTEVVTGEFSNSATTNSPLLAYLLVDEENVCIVLLEYGDNRVKNSYSKSQDYEITIKDKDGNTDTFPGIMPSNGDRIYIYTALNPSRTDDARKILEKGGDISFYIEESDRRTTKYLFTVDCSGYSEAMDSLD